ncbi:MAG: hypothetical protein Q9164_007976, partial [Protoblastenia rupestris]
MASFRAPSIRYTIGNAAPCLRNVQRRWAQVHDVRFLVTHDSNTITARYLEKLQQKARECVVESDHKRISADWATREGLKNVEELKAVYQDKIQSQRKKAIASTTFPSSTPLTSSPASSTVSSPFSPPPSPPQPVASASSPTKPTSPPGIKTLSSYIDIPKTLQLPQREIEYIWRLRHASNPQSLCAIIPLETYSRIENTARRYPR